MNIQGGNFTFALPMPTLSLSKVFNDIKTMQKDNLNDLPIETKDEKGEQEIKGLKFIAKKIKILLQKNKKIQYNEASRILINNFANEEKAQRNIKRRVYDAINVLVSAGVITKNDNRIQLVQQKKPNFNKKSDKLLTGKQKVLNQEQKQQNLKLSLQEKKKLKKQLQSRLKLLKSIYTEKERKNKKQKQSSQMQQCYVVPWQGVIDQVLINKKKKTNITIKGGKAEESSSSLLNFLCKTKLNNDI